MFLDPTQAHGDAMTHRAGQTLLRGIWMSCACQRPPLCRRSAPSCNHNSKCFKHYCYIRPATGQVQLLRLGTAEAAQHTLTSRTPRPEV